MTTFCIGDTVKTRKPHACKNNVWQVLRVGADYKLKCVKCGHVVTLDSNTFHKVVQDGNKQSTTK